VVDFWDRRMAMAISEKAIRIQILVNNRRPIDGPVEIRFLLLSLLERMGLDE
jgi:hypothetical protein